MTLVELDPEMTRLFSTNPRLTKLNDHSFQSLKVKIVNHDAFPWLRENQERFDAIIVDFPDPSNFSIGKLYKRPLLAELLPFARGLRCRRHPKHFAFRRQEVFLVRGGSRRWDFAPRPTTLMSIFRRMGLCDGLQA